MSNETLVIEAVSDKFKNKYSAGSVLAGGKWMQVSSKLNLSDFRKDSEVTVETKTNDKGYTSIVALLGAPARAEAPKAVRKPVEPAQEAPVNKGAFNTPEEAQAVRSYQQNKDERILVQGLTQAVAQSPSLACLPGTDVQAIANNITDLTDLLIAYVKSK